MSQLEQFDVVILGSGQGGKRLAWHLGRSGKKVAVIERRWVGGSCPAVACLPSKNELWSARVSHLVQNAAQFGTLATAVETDMRKVRSTSTTRSMEAPSPSWRTRDPRRRPLCGQRRCREMRYGGVAVARRRLAL